MLNAIALFFDNPEIFNPDRWADNLQKRLPTFAYFPFGGGPRICIGKAFAQMEALLLLASIAQKFHLILPPDQTVNGAMSQLFKPGTNQIAV
jgi:cytochrome P450